MYVYEAHYGYIKECFERIGAHTHIRCRGENAVTLTGTITNSLRDPVAEVEIYIQGKCGVVTYEAMVSSPPGSGGRDVIQIIESCESPTDLLDQLVIDIKSKYTHRPGWHGVWVPYNGYCLKGELYAVRFKSGKVTKGHRTETRGGKTVLVGRGGETLNIELVAACRLLSDSELDSGTVKGLERIRRATEYNGR